MLHGAKLAYFSIRWLNIFDQSFRILSAGLYVDLVVSFGIVSMLAC